MGKVEPLRKCLGCDEMIGKKGLLRIVRSKEREIKTAGGRISVSRRNALKKRLRKNRWSVR